MFLDEAFEDFEYVRDKLLDELSGQEEDGYKYEWCKNNLFGTKVRVTALMPDILEYLTGIFRSLPVIHKTDWLLPELPFSDLPRKGDFLLGCYWVLSRGRRNVLDYNRCLGKVSSAPGTPGDSEYKQAALLYAAADVTQAHSGFPWWPWSGNPFYE
ncbi:MAG: hypothetical protein LBK83_11495 [Treponema sp.]|jgi:hypothetical protein|nr:hypothetical protein [Treponema sp.]